MTFLVDSVLDAGLNNLITNATVLHICSAEPANYAGIAAVELASSPVTLTGPTDGTPDGRKATIPAVTDDTVDVTGTATHWALSNGTDTLVASNALTAPQAVSDTGTYSFAALDITMPDAVSV